MKLTEPQKIALKDVDAGRDHFGTSYKPAQKLVEFGLCTWVHGRLGSSRLQLTDAGREALERGLR